MILLGLLEKAFGASDDELPSCEEYYKPGFNQDEQSSIKAFFEHVQETITPEEQERAEWELTLAGYEDPKQSFENGFMSDYYTDEERIIAFDAVLESRVNKTLEHIQTLNADLMSHASEMEGTTNIPEELLKKSASVLCLATQDQDEIGTALLYRGSDEVIGSCMNPKIGVGCDGVPQWIFADETIEPEAYAQLSDVQGLATKQRQALYQTAWMMTDRAVRQEDPSGDAPIQAFFLTPDTIEVISTACCYQQRAMNDSSAAILLRDYESFCANDDTYVFSGVASGEKGAELMCRHKDDPDPLEEIPDELIEELLQQLEQERQELPEPEKQEPAPQRKPAPYRPSQPAKQKTIKA